MKMFLSLTTAASLILCGSTFASAQHYTQVNLVANTSGVAPVTDPNLVNPWESRALPAALGGFPTTHWPKYSLQRRWGHQSTRRDHS